MKTYILAWNPASSELTEERFNSALRNMEWGNLFLSFPEKPAAKSGENFYLVRTGTSSDGIVAKGFFISDPYLRSKLEHTYVMDVRPSFMVTWEHPLGLLDLEGVRLAVPEFPNLEDGFCQELPSQGATKLNALWDYYTSRFDVDDFFDCLAGMKERPVAGIDEAVAMASEAHFDQTDIEGEPVILDCLAVGLAGKTDDEKICGFLHEMLDKSTWLPGDIREKGFEEHIIDTLCLLATDYHIPFEDYIKAIAASGNKVAIAVKINSLKRDLTKNSHLDHKDMYESEKAALESLLAASAKE